MVAPFRLDSLPVPELGGGDDAASPASTNGTEAGAGSRRERRHRRGRRRSRRVFVALTVLVLVLGAAGVFAEVRLRAAQAPPTLRSAMAGPVHVPAQDVTLPWPAMGQGAVSVPALGIDVGSPGEQPVPVASLTKLMTAYVVLRDHPLAPGAPGPNITVTPADVADYDTDTVSDASNALVQAGEVLTESQVMAGMLIHSADNYADLIARWDAGNEAAFVAKMNAAAAALGMDHSHFADPSGLSPGSQSTAQDILKVAALDMESASVREMVRQPNVTLPLAGTIRTYTPLLGLDGILGVKSGFTNAAGGCDVVAVVRTVHGQPVLLLAAVVAQQGPGVLVAAGLHGLDLVNNAQRYIGSMLVLRSGQPAARVTDAGRTVGAATAGSASVLTWPGATATRVFHPARTVSNQATKGTRIGSVVVSLGTQRVVVPVRLDRDVPRLTLLQRLF
jgi:D-alanyl-D-alanine carboxypeptidase (penicillin-binding protein 5/6)